MKILYGPATVTGKVEDVMIHKSGDLPKYHALRLPGRGMHIVLDVIKSLTEVRLYIVPLSLSGGKGFFMFNYQTRIRGKSFV